MPSRVGVVLLISGLLVGCNGGPTQPGTPVAPSDAWPQFRGPTGDGVAAAAACPPIQIDLATHTVWKVPVPARGFSSPIVLGDRIYLTGEGHRIMAFDRDTGRLVWDTTLQAPPEPPLGEDEFPFEAGEYGAATPTACTDGQRVYAFFSTGVMGCVDLEGEPVWVRQLAVRPLNVYGVSASPVVHDGAVIQLIDLDANEDEDEPVFRSFIVALGATDGEPLWRKPRPVYGSWGSPLLIGGESGAELITCADPWVIAYDPTDGAELWRAGGLLGELAAMPVATDQRVYAFSDPSGNILAIRRGGRGDITDTHVEWTCEEDVPEVASGVCDGARLIYANPTGSIRCIDAATGEPMWRLRGNDSIYASLVLAAQKVFAIDIEGVLRVIDPATGTVVHQVDLGEPVSASPAFVGNRIYIRSDKHLICLGETD